MQQTYETRIIVDAPVDAVYEYFADLRHIPDYDPQVKSIRPTSGEGWLGSTFAMAFAPLGPRPRFQFPLTVERDPGRGLAYRIDGKLVTARDRVTFAAAGAGTEVTTTGTLELRSVLAPGIVFYRVMLPLIRRQQARLMTRVVNQALRPTGTFGQA
jgi:uncharacterized membrane protein